MPLVVAVDAREADELTLREWDLLRSARIVLFEEPGHPLEERLRAAGVATARWEPAGMVDAGQVVVASPRSPHLIRMAKDGADISVGAGRTPDALTAAHGAPVARRAAAAAGRLTSVMARLRSEDGCPWDQEQTHESLQVHLLEETYEVLEAIDAGSLGVDLEEELGDLLLQVAFHARLAEQEGRFDLADVADGLVAKLVHRHPHVFGEVEVADAAEVVRNWERIKGDEKRERGPWDGIPKDLSALLAAFKTQKRAAALGFSADLGEAAERAHDALSAASHGASDPAEALGDALFWIVAAARAASVDPEAALRRASSRFRASIGSASPLPETTE